MHSKISLPKSGGECWSVAVRDGNWMVEAALYGNLRGEVGCEHRIVFCKRLKHGAKHAEKSLDRKKFAKLVGNIDEDLVSRSSPAYMHLFMLSLRSPLTCI